LQKVGPGTPQKENGILGDIEELNETLKRYPWTILSSMRGDAKVLRKLEETEKLLKDLRKALAE
jgi:hypothetical protein